MQKLIELLNEYEAKDYEIKPGAVFWHLSGANEPLYAGWTAYASSFQIYSKEYGFIKWLVDNDKIDTGGKITEDLTYEYFQIPRKYFRGGKYARLSEEMNDIFYHRILACLSIQDNPIEFLVSILK